MGLFQDHHIESITRLPPAASRAGEPSRALPSRAQVEPYTLDGPCPPKVVPAHSRLPVWILVLAVPDARVRSDRHDDAITPLKSPQFFQFQSTMRRRKMPLAPLRSRSQ